jgi:hypothetical protein
MWVGEEQDRPLHNRAVINSTVCIHLLIHVSPAPASSRVNWAARGALCTTRCLIWLDPRTALGGERDGHLRYETTLNGSRRTVACSWADIRCQACQGECRRAEERGRGGQVNAGYECGVRFAYGWAAGRTQIKSTHMLRMRPWLLVQVMRLLVRQLPTRNQTLLSSRLRTRLRSTNSPPSPCPQADSTRRRRGSSQRRPADCLVPSRSQHTTFKTYADVTEVTLSRLCFIHSSQTVAHA